MNHDLSTALGELAARVEHTHRTTGPALPVERIAARARHRRHVRTALVSAGSAAAVLVLAVGTAYAVRPAPHPAPPAHTVTPTTSPTPSPTPTVDPVVLPTGDPAKAYGTCGSLVSATPDPPVDPRFTAHVDVTSPTVRADALLELTTWVTPSESDDSTGAFVSVLPGAGPRLAVARDGVVVATADLTQGHPTADEVFVAWGENADTHHLGAIGLSVCDAGGAETAGRPLPPGRYELHPWGEVTAVGDDESVAYGDATVDELRAMPGAQTGTATGPTTEIEVVGDPTVAAVASWSTVPLEPGPASPVPECGDPAPTGPTAPWMFELDVDHEPVTVAAGTSVEGHGRLTSRGPDRLRPVLGWLLEYVVVQDGVVVGVTIEYQDGWTRPVDFGHDTGMDVDAGAALTGCTPFGDTPEPLPAGTYTVFPAVVMTSIRAQAGDAALSDDVQLVLGDPFPVTLT